MIAAVKLLQETASSISNKNISSQTDAQEINFLTYLQYALVKLTLSMVYSVLTRTILSQSIQLIVCNFLVFLS